MQTQTQTTDEILATIQAAADAADHAIRVMPDNAAIGAVARQGDVLYVRVPDDFPRGAAYAPAERQVVTGETLGSRHTVEAPAKCYTGTTVPRYLGKDGRLHDLAPQAFLGACVVAPTRVLAPHPEHAHLSLPQGTWQVVQQRDERTAQRMAD